MTDLKSQGELQTKPLQPDKPAPLATLHIVAYLRWEREWYETFETRRAKLLDIIARLREQMTADGTNTPMRTFLLGGQTVILEDIAAVRPDLLTLFSIYNAGGRVGLGPWYIAVDETLVSGESLIRNLLAARADASHYGLRLMTVAYMLSSSGHPAQLPQILRDFEIDAAFLRHGADVVHMPFRWESPDGSSVLAVNHQMFSAFPFKVMDAWDVRKSVLDQKSIRPDGPYLWLFDVSNPEQSLSEMLPDVAKRTGLPLEQSDLKTYVEMLRRELPDSLRPSLQGELRLQALRENAFLFPGMLSSRIYLKQMNARLQACLLSAVEPWLTLALSHGQIKYPENNRALLNYAWRTLMKNQAIYSLGGAASDAVHQENELRYRQVADTCQHIIHNVLQALPGEPLLTNVEPDAQQTHIMVWNSHNWTVKQVVTLQLQLPPNKHPAKLSGALESESDMLYAWQPETKTLSFLATVPAMGYAAYTLDLSSEPPDLKRYGINTVKGQVIARVTGEKLTVQDGKLTWKLPDNRVIDDLLRFIDEGDAGDAYNFSPPKEDVVVQADLINDVQVESSPLYQRLILRHRMRVAPHLKEDRTRDRGVKLIELRTTATFYEHLPGVHFRTTFENTAKDHRLRAHLRTGINTDRVTVDSPFNLLERPAHLTDEITIPSMRRNMEAVSNTHPMQTLAAVRTGTSSLALLVRGLPEYEAIPEADQITMPLTLVRAVGWLSRDDLRTRTALVAPMIETPEAQCLREFTAEYSLVNTTPGDKAELIRTAAEFNAPLQAYQYATIPERRSRSYLSIVSDQAVGADSDGAGAIMTSLKPPEKGNGWIVRLFNPLDKAVEVYVTPFKRPERAYLITMAEELLSALEPDANGRIGVVINPHEILTMRIVFETQENAIIS